MIAVPQHHSGDLPTLSPRSSDASTAAVKRKRTVTDDAPQTNGTSPLPTKKCNSTNESSELLINILAVLQNHDTTPSILNLKISDQSQGEPQAKRTKLTQSSSSTISDRLKEGEYTNLEALMKDVSTAAEELLAPIKAKEAIMPSYPYGRPSALSAADVKLCTGVIAFQKMLGEIVRAEISRKLSKGAVRVPSKEQPTTNGVTVKMESEDGISTQYGRNVLTMFANAPGPRQLFSSFQQPVNSPAISKSLDVTMDVVPYLRESGLPSFIGTTKISAIGLQDTKSNKSKGSKLGELFAPPANLPRLQPPKPTKQMTTKGNVISFVPNDKPVKSERRNSYNWCAAKQTVGQWLGYGGIDVPQEPISPQAKRKQRDRALSTGEAYLVPSESEKLALQKAKEDALFRKVYGAFAPTHDDSGAIVPTGIRNEIWWNKIGERYAQKTMVVDSALLGLPDPVRDSVAGVEEDFKEVVENFDPELLGLDKLQTERTEEKEVDEILAEISSLLETLSSYQRVRNSTLTSSARTTVGLNSPLTEMVGSPSTPSTAEVEVYKTLKAQLALLIASLPPYAVARLNGDQMEELNIKTSILIETESHRGVMAEDEAARIAKQQVSAPAAVPPVSSINRSSSGNSYANYSAATQYNRTPVASAPRSGTAQSHLLSQQASSRAAPLPFQRSSSGVQTYSAGYPSTNPRPAYSQQQSYTQATPRSNHPQQPQANANHYYQQLQQITVPGGKVNYNQQYYQGTPQAQGRSYQQTPTQNYQRPQNAASQYNYAQIQSPHARTASPLTNGSTASPAHYNQPRPSYGTPTTGSQSRPSYYQTPASQAGSYANTASAGIAAGVRPSGSTPLASEQHKMLNRS